MNIQPFERVEQYDLGMEISGKILREVEFRDRLRGYDTDEVDEFLEKVAVAVDALRADHSALAERALRAESRAEEVPVPDDESIRRTLVLAQRTADLAIKEARDEAARLIEDARVHADGVIAEATENSRRMRDQAEFDLHERVGRLSEQRDRLERDVEALHELLEGERNRLSEALSSALRFVNDSLTLSDDLSSYSPSTSVPTASEPIMPIAPGPAMEPSPDDPAELPDIEAEIREDAATAVSRADDESDGVDDELWARWSNGSDLGGLNEPISGSDPFGPGRRGEHGA